MLTAEYKKANSFTVLHAAVHKNAPLPIVEKLLDLGLDINAPNKVNVEIIKHTRESSTDEKNIQKKDGATPLFIAAQNNVNPRIIELLLNNGAVVDKPNSVRSFKT